ncbi:MAG TPA: VOC family protein [Actinophytocola sp.]|jgi:catechol 2,3-dioxygenase-like lactoylglutathione lyase family enzyme|nr:VOC family protein [Actinophytocola sp.]
MATLQGFHHVKLPVTDVARSRAWYERVLGLELRMEFVEEGVLMGVALWDPGRTVQLALRCDPDRAKAMSGFDALAIGIASRVELAAWRSRLDSAGEPHGGIIEGHAGHVLVGLRDPDGIEVRLYTVDGAE